MTAHAAPPNRLARESSPYLLQHARNPVDWFPWGPEAFETAARLDRPLLLSVGYAACHWCHVMERESFEDAATAALMNDRFVCVKVDREERPDVDQVYQTAVQVLGGHGGWPLTMFLTPDLRPFFGGTYYPKERRHGLPAFRQVLEGVSEAYRQRRAQVGASADQLVGVLRDVDRGEAGAAAGLDGRDGLDGTLPAAACEKLLGRWDDEHHGFGRRPKFPNSLLLEAFVRAGGAFAERARASFLAMARGGTYDQLGGGFHRYSTDEAWLVPHFEKMLYDNALLLRLGAQLWQRFGDEEVARVLRETFAWAMREMRGEGGAFHATQDADSEGEEGRFFAWDPAEVLAVLGEAEGARFCEAYGVFEGGNFEHGRSVLHRRTPDAGPALDDARRRLFEARALRVAPAKDDKVLAGWNGLFVHGLAAAGAALGEPAMVEAAREASRFVWERMRVDGRLRRSWRAGEARIDAFAEDHAFLAEGELELFAASGDVTHLHRARWYVDAANARFEDPEGGYFLAPADGDPMPLRPRSVYDNAVPSATSALVQAQLRLAALTGEGSYVARAERALVRLQPAMAKNPFAYGWLLCGLFSATRGVGTLAVTGAPGDAAREALLREARGLFLPETMVVAVAGATLRELFPYLPQDGARAAAYLCVNGTCRAPVSDPAELRALTTAG